MKLEKKRRLYSYFTITVILLLFAVTHVQAYYNGNYSVVAPNINQGATVFIGEEGLNLSPALALVQAQTGSPSTTIGWWAFVNPLVYPLSRSVDIAGNETHFFVSPDNFVGYTGNWYLVNSSTGFAYNVNGSPAIVMSVSDPTLEISAWDIDRGVEVTSKSATIGDRLTFRIDTNMYRALDNIYRYDNINNTQEFITIKVKDENGTTLTYLPRDNSTNQSLTNLSVNSSPWFWGGGTTPGQNYWATALLDRSQNYVFSAESSLNGMKDNYKNGGVHYTGKTVSQWHTMSLVEPALKIETSLNTVERGKMIFVCVTGIPLTTYHLWIENTSIMTGNPDDQPPSIAPNQEGVTFDSDPGLHRNCACLSRCRCVPVPRGWGESDLSGCQLQLAGFDVFFLEKRHCRICKHYAGQ